MKPLPRRTFLKSTLAAGIGTSVLGSTTSTWARPKGANEAINVAVVGCRGKGSSHIRDFMELSDCRVMAICDPDQAILDREVAKLKEQEHHVKTYLDARKLMEDDEVDAVVIATPNHWHSLMAIWACQAGKDVYVEKPVTHNVVEGAVLLKAADRYGRIVQAGTQNRSDDGFRAGLNSLADGKLGKILWAHGVWYRTRDSIGKINGPRAVPATLDYDLWTGPAALTPLNRVQLHYDWHWQWKCGDGELGNSGVHQMDDCIYALGIDTYPRRVMSLGGRYAWNDDGETPNMHLALLDYDEVPVMIEVRNLPMKAGVDYPANLLGRRMTNVIQCEHGYFMGGRGRGSLFDLDGNRLEDYPGDGGRTHQQNFLDAIRKRDRSLLKADVKGGVLSGDLCTLSNLSYRIGHAASVAEVQESIGDFAHGQEALASLIGNLEANGIDLGMDGNPLTLGTWLDLDKHGKPSADDRSQMALLESIATPTFRKPYSLPKIS